MNDSLGLLVTLGATDHSLSQNVNHKQKRKKSHNESKPPLLTTDSIINLRLTSVPKGHVIFGVKVGGLRKAKNADLLHTVRK